MWNEKPKHKNDELLAERLLGLESDAVHFFNQLFPIEPDSIRVHLDGFYEAEYAPHHTVHGDLAWLQKRQGFELRFEQSDDGDLIVFVRERRHMPLLNRLKSAVSDLLGG
ncbi:MAG: hypothetical protein H7175_00150 [Burkholderiales bacterium]|nr:hypothetical protein [Anaerolineae bacterium]